MSDEIERVSAGLVPRQFDEAVRMAGNLAKARGFVPRDLEGKPHAVLAAIMTGSELGIGPMQALRSIHVIDGRPMLSADLMLALAIRGGVRHQWTESTPTVARLRLTREGFEPHEHAFTLEEAERAGLTRKTNWQRYAPAMLRARCLSAALRAFCPDVLGAGIYVEGEIEAEPPRREPPPEPPSETRSLDEQITDAEIVDSFEADDAQDATPEPPAHLHAARDELELRSWIERYGAKVAKRGPAAVAKVVEHAEKIGVPGDTVRGWLSGGEAA